MSKQYGALLSLSKNGSNTWFYDEKPGDVALYTTASTASVLIGGGSSAGRPAAVTIGSTDVHVQGVATAALVKSYGFTVTLPPGVDASTDLDKLLASVNDPGSNPYVWASNASVSARGTAEAALTMAAFASNAVYSFSSIPDAIESVLWTSNQVADLLDARDGAVAARVESRYASNVAIVALRRADLASNAAYEALSLTTVSTTAAYHAAVYASNAGTAASNAAFPASNLVFQYLPHAADAATWASNTARVGSGQAFFASNVVAELSTEVQIASDKATSAYITATSTAGLAVWSSNAASLASRDALTAYSLAVSVSMQDSQASAQSNSATARDATYASNGVREAASNAAAALVRTGVASNVLYPVRAQATFGSNAAASAASASASASAVASAAASAAAGARSNADRALVLASGGVSASAGGSIAGDLRFGNVASIRDVVSVGVGTAAPQYPVHVTSTATEEDVSIWVAGQIQQMSDRRDKADIERIDSALDKLMAIRGYTYRHRTASNIGSGSGSGSGSVRACGEHRFAGVLAQEVQATLPEAVHIHPETNQMSVSYNSLIPLLIEAIHELVEMFDVKKCGQQEQEQVIAESRAAPHANELDGSNR